MPSPSHKLLRVGNGRRARPGDGPSPLDKRLARVDATPGGDQLGLRELQRLAARAIFRPLGRGGRMQRTWLDGRATSDVVAEFIKPNDRLSSLERIEIYNRQYWFRILDCLYDDYPGLRAILGERRFHDLRVAYLTKYPSASFTLRNLGGRLEQFLREEPRWTSPRQEICLEMARFEWAQIVAFDGPAKPALAPGDLLNSRPSKLRLGLQPYLSLLELSWPLDDFVMAVKKRDVALRSEASNAISERDGKHATHRPRLPRREPAFIAVHRHENDLYYKRLDAIQFRLLSALRDGATLQRACQQALASEDDPSLATRIGDWFRVWTELGWFCKRS
jgi:hypothetical protein